MKPLIAKLVWPAYFAALAYFAYLSVTTYLDATSILKDHTVVEAPVELLDTSYRTRRGHTTTTYKFRYTYTVDGKDYSVIHSAVNEKGERYLEAGSATVASSNTNPSNAGVLVNLENQSSIGRFIKSLLIIALVLGILGIFVYGWALPDEEDEEDLAESATTRSA